MNCPSGFRKEAAAYCHCQCQAKNTEYRNSIGPVCRVSLLSIRHSAGLRPPPCVTCRVFSDGGGRSESICMCVYRGDQHHTRSGGRKPNKAQFEIEISTQKTAMKSTLGRNKRKQPVSPELSRREKPLEKKEVLDYFTCPSYIRMYVSMYYYLLTPSCVIICSSKTTTKQRFV